MVVVVHGRAGPFTALISFVLVVLSVAFEQENDTGYTNFDRGENRRLVTIALDGSHRLQKKSFCAVLLYGLQEPACFVL